MAFGQGRARCYRIADISSVVDIGVERDLSEPDPLRLTYRSVIKHAVRAVVLSTKGDQLDIIQTFVTKNVEDQDKESVRSLVIDEIRRLHEGVLSRYDLRISEFNVWKNQT